MSNAKKNALGAIILAAGKGTRMKSETPKVLHEVAGEPMLRYPLDICKSLKAKRAVVVVGFGKERVEAAFASYGVDFAEQKEQLGTGHAVKVGLEKLKGFNGACLILSGDVPLITKETLKGLVNFYGRTGATIALVSAVLKDPSGYGRIVRGPSGSIERITEDKDCNAAQRAINEINAGIYLIDAAFLRDNVKKLGNSNAQGEFYLPDLVPLALKAGKKVAVLTHFNHEEIMGINNRVELAAANGAMRRRILNDLMLSGVTIVDPATTFIDCNVAVGRDTVIRPGVHLKKGAVIGPGCVIEEGSIIAASNIAGGTVIKSYSIVEGSKVGRNCVIGPFARLRPDNVLSDEVRVGNFVELKKCVVGKGTKANHLTYLGDAEIGSGVNVGAGTITCNYDGVNKFKTIIMDNSFIGSDSQIVAPVTVGRGAYVASGTTVTKDVPPDSLVLTRAAEVVVKGWAKKKREGKKSKKR